MEFKNNNSEIILMYSQKFGQIAINMKFASTEQVQEALVEQITYNSSTRIRPRKLIGEILFENGWMTVNQIERVLQELSEDQN